MNITDDNFFILAAKAYQPVCLSKDDFIKDVRSINYIKADITRYLRTNSHPNLRTVINRFIVASNNFGPVDAMKFTFYAVRQNEVHITVLKTIFTFLQIMPEIISITDALSVDDRCVINEELLKELEHVAKIR